MKKTVIAGSLLITLILSGFMVQADDSFTFHESVQEGEIFEWNISITTEDTGSYPVEDEDVIALEIMDDPGDSGITDPYDVQNITINGEAPDFAFVLLFLGMMIYGVVAGFLAPLEWNDENYMDVIYDLELDLAANYNGQPDTTAAAEQTDSKVSLEVLTDNGVNSTRIYTEYDAKKGFLKTFELETTEGNTTGYFGIKKGGSLFDRIPFNWSYAIIGILSLGLITVVTRRKR